jgi:hypothetical protein
MQWLPRQPRPLDWLSPAPAPLAETEVPDTCVGFAVLVFAKAPSLPNVNAIDTARSDTTCGTVFTVLCLNCGRYRLEARGPKAICSVSIL